MQSTPPSPIIDRNVRTSTTTPMLWRMSLTIMLRARFKGKQRSLICPSKAANPGARAEYRGFARPKWHYVTAFLYDINRDWLDYKQRHQIKLSTDSLWEIKLRLDRLICCPDPQPESVYKLSFLASGLGLNEADRFPIDTCLDVPAPP